MNGAADAADEVARQIEALHEDPSDLETPISISIDLQSVRSGVDPQTGGLHQVLPLLEDINSAVHSNSNEIARLRENTPSSLQRQAIMDMEILGSAVNGNDPYGFIASVGGMRLGAPWLHELGVAAYTRALAGDFYTARRILTQMSLTLRARYQTSEAFLQRVAPESETLLDRLIDSKSPDPMTDVDDLPF